MIKPTDEIGVVKFFNCDSEKALKLYNDNFFKIAFSDPPYGIGMSKPAGNSQKYSKKKLIDSNWDSEAMSKEFFIEQKRVSKDQIIWGANHFIDNLPEPRKAAGWLIWDKRENFIPERTYADAEMAWTSIKTPIRVFRFFWDGFMQKIKEKRIHPTQKPVSLYEWKLIKFCKKGDLILDPFGGSFSSAIACHNLGYELHIFERDEVIYKDGLRRFKEHVAQQTLF